MAGANLPWVSYGNDFGASAWHPRGGLASNPANLARLDEAFARMEGDGLRHARVFLLDDLRSGVRFAPDGTPLGLDEHFFADVDAMLRAAHAHGVRITFALFDFSLLDPARVVNGVQMGGRSALVRDPAQRRALIENIVRPIFDRYGHSPDIAAWDLMNEPEWRTRGLRGRRDATDATSSEMHAFLAALNREAHARTMHPVTVGSVGLDGVSLVSDLGLDFYQVHSYPDRGEPAVPGPVDALALNRPIVLGEFSGARSPYTPSQFFDAALSSGYAGAWIWSALDDCEHSGYPEEDIRGWTLSHGAWDCR